MEIGQAETEHASITLPFGLAYLGQIFWEQKCQKSEIRLGQIICSKCQTFNRPYLYCKISCTWPNCRGGGCRQCLPLRKTRGGIIQLTENSTDSSGITDFLGHVFNFCNRYNA